MTTPNERKLQSYLEDAFPVAPASDALRSRIAQIAAQSEQQQSRRTQTRRRLKWAAACACGLAGAAAVTAVWPRLAAAQALRRMDAAIAGARNCRYEFWIMRTDGKYQEKGRVWLQNGAQRTESDVRAPEVEIRENGRVWQYYRDNNIVRCRRESSAEARPSSGFTIQALKHDDALWRRDETIRLGAATSFAGRPAHTVTVENDSGQPYRQELLVDTATDLPISGKLYVRLENQWVLSGGETCEYNQSLPPSLFTPVFPKTARVINEEQSHTELRRRLAKGVAARTAADRKIVIRDIQTNASGDVFLLYSAGKYPGDLFNCRNKIAGRDWKMTLTDDRGTHYRHQGYLGSIYNVNAEPRNLFVYNGERLEGDWWIPEVSQSPWKPRRLTLTFQINSVNLHGGENVPRMKADYARSVPFTLSVRTPGCQKTPDYFWDLSLSAIDTDSAEALAREGDAFEAAFSAADAAEHKSHDYPRALAKYQEAIALETKRERDSGHCYGTKSWLWSGVYRVQTALGHHPEALGALRNARDEALRGDQSMHFDPSRDYHLHQVELTMKQEGMRGDE